MSRTDKDRPWKIRAEDPYESDGLNYWHVYNYPHSCGPRCYYCGWTISHTSLASPPAWYRRLVWHGPERARQRQGLHNMVKEWNSNYYLDDEDFENRQARSCAKYWWW